MVIYFFMTLILIGTNIKTILTKLLTETNMKHNTVNMDKHETELTTLFKDLVLLFVVEKSLSKS
jgi:hypothetical protein